MQNQSTVCFSQSFEGKTHFETLFHEGSRSGKDINFIKRQLDRMSDVNALSIEGDTPLMVAVWFDRADVVDLLLNDDRVDANIQNNSENGVSNGM